MKNYGEWSCIERSNEKYDFGNNDIRRWYQRDIDQIVHSTAFRKLQKKSQLLSEHDPRSRSRLIHTIEVSRIALEICEKLGLCKELAEAISMGHDIATSPYGFVGNDFLKRHAKGKKSSKLYTHEDAGAYMIETIAQKKLSDQHMINSAASAFGLPTAKKTGYQIIPVDKFPWRIMVSRSKKDNGQYVYYGYFISPEVVDGIRNHGGIGHPNTLEGQVVKFSDNIAYLSQDIDDLMYSRILPSPEDYTKFEADDALTNRSGKTMKWSEIDHWEDLEKTAMPSLKGLFNRSRGIRIATLISRFVNYNMELLDSDKDIEFVSSNILDKEVPVLKLDDGLAFVLDFLWEFIESFYSNTLIKTSNELQKAKLQQVWEILQDNEFMSKNVSYKMFMKSLKDSRFDNRGDKWKLGYFISHLSWSDIDTIISSFHRRDYSFEIDFEEGGNENN